MVILCCEVRSIIVLPQRSHASVLSGDCHATSFDEYARGGACTS
jgi:hypothetical protein